MKYLFPFFLMTILLSCHQADAPESNQVDTLKHSDVFNGAYSGVTPCADCPGIKMQVNFSPDSFFYESLDYLERDTKFSDTGRWNKSDSLITVDFPGKLNAQKRFFKVMNDSVIQMLDGDGNVITGPLADHYILKKADTVLP